MMIDRTRRFEKLIEHSRTSTRMEITARLSEEGNLCGVKHDGSVSQKGRNPSTPHYSRRHIRDRPLGNGAALDPLHSAHAPRAGVATGQLARGGSRVLAAQ